MRPNPRDWALYPNCQRFEGSLPDTPTRPVKQETKKCFQTEFKVEFRGVLQRTFAGIEAVKEFEVNFIRPVLPQEALDVPECQNDKNEFKCWIIEYSDRFSN